MKICLVKSSFVKDGKKIEFTEMAVPVSVNGVETYVYFENYEGDYTGKSLIRNNIDNAIFDLRLVTKDNTTIQKPVVSVNGVDIAVKFKPKSDNCLVLLNLGRRK